MNMHDDVCSSDFPLGFDYRTLITDEDRALRKLVLSQYSRKALDHIADKHGFSFRGGWEEYDRGVRELVARKLPQKEFVKDIRKLAEETQYLCC